MTCELHASCSSPCQGDLSSLIEYFNVFLMFEGHLQISASNNNLCLNVLLSKIHIFTRRMSRGMYSIVSYFNQECFPFNQNWKEASPDK